DLYDTRHVVYAPRHMSPARLEEGYWSAYRDFYRWNSIRRGAMVHERGRDRLRHIAYAGGWKKLEPAWDLVIRGRQIAHALPVLEHVLAAFGGRVNRARPAS
ncbi:MAG TPA: hypothetical protein VFB40_15795, partial [Actinocrinis sp.]